MVKALFSRLFGSLRGTLSSTPAPAAAAAAATPAVAGAPALPLPGAGDPVVFVDYVVKALVDTPAEVKVTRQDDARGVLIRVACRKSEIGRIIGKRGKTIAAIRALAQVAAGNSQQKLSIVIMED